MICCGVALVLAVRVRRLTVGSSPCAASFEGLAFFAAWPQSPCGAWGYAFVHSHIPPPQSSMGLSSV